MECGCGAATLLNPPLPVPFPGVGAVTGFAPAGAQASPFGPLFHAVAEGGRAPGGAGNVMNPEVCLVRNGFGFGIRAKDRGGRE